MVGLWRFRAVTDRARLSIVHAAMLTKHPMGQDLCCARSAWRTPLHSTMRASNASTPRSVEESDGDREGKTHEDSIEQIEHGDQQPGLLARPPKRALDHGGERDA